MSRLSRSRSYLAPAWGTFSRHRALTCGAQRQAYARRTRIRDPRGSKRGCMASGANRDKQTVGSGAVAANTARPLTWRDIRGTIRRHADELVFTEAEAA